MTKPPNNKIEIQVTLCGTRHDKYASAVCPYCFCDFTANVAGSEGVAIVEVRRKCRDHLKICPLANATQTPQQATAHAPVR